MRHIALTLLGHLREEHSTWTLDELKKGLGLPDSLEVEELAMEAGFLQREALSAAEENQILRIMLNGILDPKKIAAQTQIPLKQVREYVEATGTPYGAGGFGEGPWSGKRPADVPEEAEERRTSAKGQFSYNGKVYNLGIRHRRRVCWVEAASSRLRVYLDGQAPLALKR